MNNPIDIDQADIQSSVCAQKWTANIQKIIQSSLGGDWVGRGQDVFFQAYAQINAYLKEDTGMSFSGKVSLLENVFNVLNSEDVYAVFRNIVAQAEDQTGVCFYPSPDKKYKEVVAAILSTTRHQVLTDIIDRCRAQCVPQSVALAPAENFEEFLLRHREQTKVEDFQPTRRILTARTLKR